MINISTKEARDQLAEILNRAASAKERVVVTQDGKSVAAIVPIEDLEFLEALEDRIDIEEARAALAEAEKDGTIPWDKIKAELGL